MNELAREQSQGHGLELRLRAVKFLILLFPPCRLIRSEVRRRTLPEPFRMISSKPGKSPPCKARSVFELNRDRMQFF